MTGPPLLKRSSPQVSQFCQIADVFDQSIPPLVLPGPFTTDCDDSEFYLEPQTGSEGDWKGQHQDPVACDEMAIQAKLWIGGFLTQRILVP